MSSKLNDMIQLVDIRVRVMSLKINFLYITVQQQRNVQKS